MINIERMKKSKGFTYELCELPKVDGDFIKQLRVKLNMSQSMFAILLHVTKKTVEKWEQGKNPITNGNFVSVILLDKHPELVEDFIKITVPEYDLQKYAFDAECEKKEDRKEIDVFSSDSLSNNHSLDRQWKMCFADR